MKIAVAGGHSAKAPGASGLLDEYQCDRNFKDRLLPALEKAGFEVVDCSNEEPTVMGEMQREVSLANASGADYFLAIHLNAGGGTGTECWHYTGSEAGRVLAERMSANVAAALGLPNRGAKHNTAFFVVRKTNMPAVLLETCFVDHVDDAHAWWDTPWDRLVQAVVDAFAGIDTGSTEKPSPAPSYAPTRSLEVDGWWGPATVRACQSALGTTADGCVSGQDYRDMRNIGGVPSTAWEVGSGGSQMVKAIQRKVGANEDGYFGPNTCRALQTHLGTPVDGIVSRPSQMVVELQRRLNAGTF